MRIDVTRLPGVVVVSTDSMTDTRGSFTRLFCAHELAATIGERSIVQINHSRTAVSGMVRGLHFQYPPKAEMKLVRCLKGRAFDVAVDLRAGSPTFLQWHGEELTPARAQMLVIPEGCAHGFQALEPDCELLYLHTAAYTRESEAGFRFDDQMLAIRWPLPVAGASDRDRGLPTLGADFTGIRV